VNVSFGDASRFCAHCSGHHHGDETTHEHGDASEPIHFSAKCCCEDFESEIHFAEDYTFSTEKNLVLSLPSVIVSDVCRLVVDEEIKLVSHCFTHEKIPYLLTGRLRTIFFSNLKINPLI
jgi:hypothetical protein